MKLRSISRFFHIYAMRVRLKSHQIHTFSFVLGERFRGSTLCPQPSERIQLLLFILSNDQRA